MTRNRVLAVLAATLLALVVPIRPAEAHEDHCGGLVGTLVTGTQLWYPSLGPPAVNTSFNATFAVGDCLSGNPPPSLTGRVSGNCGLANGVGQTSGGHTFEFIWSGDYIFFSPNVGNALGVLVVEADRFSGHSCTSGATRFIIPMGAVKEYH